MKTKMWCLCRKKDGKPIEVEVDEEMVATYVIGFPTKKSLIEAAGIIEDDEVIKKIIFEY